MEPSADRKTEWWDLGLLIMVLLLFTVLVVFYFASPSPTHSPLNCSVASVKVVSKTTNTQGLVAVRTEFIIGVELEGEVWLVYVPLEKYVTIKEGDLITVCYNTDCKHISRVALYQIP